MLLSYVKKMLSLLEKTNKWCSQSQGRIFSPVLKLDSQHFIISFHSGIFKMLLEKKILIFIFVLMWGCFSSLLPKDNKFGSSKALTGVLIGGVYSEESLLGNLFGIKYKHRFFFCCFSEKNFFSSCTFTNPKITLFWWCVGRGNCGEKSRKIDHLSLGFDIQTFTAVPPPPSTSSAFSAFCSASVQMLRFWFYLQVIFITFTFHFIF